MMPDIPPIDSLLWKALPDLTLNIAQTAALCSISVRQLGYWTRQGYVTASGQGTRRTYGLPAIRRVLAIRKAMDAGASLRQSLRQVSSELPQDELSEETLFSEALTDSGLSPLEASMPPATGTPGSVQDAVLKRSLIAFFQMNCYTRDHAGGLAVKLGWAEEDVRVAADGLCLSGVLFRDVCQGMTVFRSAAWGKYD